ncbi:helix-turn-helix transcriptional regulator [Streptomyces zaomyceticus]|uniref:Helix-turn-helix transcriptional regulator n=1 Tax=Streptomyces zaomyceticus TaxID=68286 RepID=A0ABZ1LHN1_9ACTN
MPEAPSARIEEARQRVAKRLRDLRLDARLTGQDIVERTGWQKSKVSRLQNGVTPPSADDIRTWCKVCGADDEVIDIIEAARSADSLYSDWRRENRRGLKPMQVARAGVHRSTAQMRVYSSTLVPGLLQTRAYAVALLADIARAKGIPDDSAAAADARVERASIIREGGRTFAFVVEEAALRRHVGDADVMAAQLLHLLDAARYPAVSLGVIPAGAPARWPLETFTVYDDEKVFVELLTAALTITTPSEVAQYVEAHREMTRSAVFGPEAYRIIAGAIPGPS